MARYIEDHRYTPQLIPASLDELLPESSVARSLWAALSRLDFEAHDARFRNDAEGRPALNPRCLTAVWMLGMLRGVTSSVRLADLCGRDVEFRWLLGFAPVEKSTLCSFRKDYPQALVSLSTQVLGLLGENDLLPGKNAGVDGTIVRAAASRHAVKRRGRLERQRERLRSTIEERLSAVDGSSLPNPGDAALREQQITTGEILGVAGQGRAESRLNAMIFSKSATTMLTLSASRVMNHGVKRRAPFKPITEKGGSKSQPERITGGRHTTYSVLPVPQFSRDTATVYPLSFSSAWRFA